MDSSYTAFVGLLPFNHNRTHRPWKHIKRRQDYNFITFLHKLMMHLTRPFVQIQLDLGLFAGRLQSFLRRLNSHFQPSPTSPPCMSKISRLLLLRNIFLFDPFRPFRRSHRSFCPLSSVLFRFLKLTRHLKSHLFACTILTFIELKTRSCFSGL